MILYHRVEEVMSGSAVRLLLALATLALGVACATRSRLGASGRSCQGAGSISPAFREHTRIEDDPATRDAFWASLPPLSAGEEWTLDKPWGGPALYRAELHAWPDGRCIALVEFIEGRMPTLYSGVWRVHSSARVEMEFCTREASPWPRWSAVLEGAGDVRWLSIPSYRSLWRAVRVEKLEGTVSPPDASRYLDTGPCCLPGHSELFCR